MTLAQALAALEKAGTAQNRKVYARHGVGGPQYGVSYAELGKLKKMIGTDHDLALALWATGNHDARILATMVADPAACTARALDAWAREADSPVQAGAVAGVAAASPTAASRIDAWRGRRSDLVSACAYDTLAALAADTARELDEAWLLGHVAEIAATIHDRANRTRHSMNMALIAIGARGGALEKAAVAAAARIGKVDVDHGATGCKTPDAAAYIARTIAHRAGRKAKR